VKDLTNLTEQSSRRAVARRSLLGALGLSQRALAAQLGVSHPAVGRWIKGDALPTRDARVALQRLLLSSRYAPPGGRWQLLGAGRLAGPDELGDAQQKNAQSCDPGRPVADATGAAPVATADSSTSITTTVSEEDVPMLLQKATLTQQARAHFNLPRDPFTDDVQTTEDVYQSAHVRYVRTVLLDAAMHHGFVAITGESGAGKSTLAEDLEQRILDERRDVVVVRPYVLQMELSDAKGKTLKSGEIARAIIRTLDETLTCKSSPDALMRQLHTLLRDSARSGRRHLLLIEEAHCLPTSTLTHLKRFLELKDGMRRLIGVALIGQTELRARLHNAGSEVREVTQRCEIVELAPLDADAGPYLAHKFARFGLRLEQVFADDAIDAIRSRLVYLPRGGKSSDTRSICYPLVVNNLVVRAMNEAAGAGYPVVDATVIAGV
jgi:type II secretory pathway predicted ATPase ExeA